MATCFKHIPNGHDRDFHGNGSVGWKDGLEEVDILVVACRDFYRRVGNYTVTAAEGALGNSF
ncbi:MAG TPA: hypothetical protein VLK33_19460 [Terriglobales bacterium]|nr:hypothetical protein [Terriglobales bacterium]